VGSPGGGDPRTERLGEAGADAERRLRREADARVLVHLAATGFDAASVEWARVRDALAEYGFAVLRVWLRGGTARRRAVQHGVMGATAIAPRYSKEDADSIAADVTVSGVDGFRERVLQRGLWTPEGGASLSTYFVRFLLMRLPNECRKRRRGTSEQEHVSIDEGLEDTPSEDAVAERKVVAAARLAEITTLLGDPDLVDTFRLLDDGFTYTEIGAMLDRSVGSLKTQVMRARKLVRTREADDD